MATNDMYRCGGGDGGEGSPGSTALSYQDMELLDGGHATMCRQQQNPRK